ILSSIGPRARLDQSPIDSLRIALAYCRAICDPAASCAAVITEKRRRRMTMRPWIGALIGVVALKGAMTGSALADETPDGGTAVATATASTVPPDGGTTVAKATDSTIPPFTMSPEAKGKDEWHFAVPVGYYWFGMQGRIGIGQFSRDFDLS